MKPLKLTMNNFGPYQHQAIDFTRLEDASIFLISGPTGSGKTTLFDAMTFALYGESASDDRDPAALRSDFAEPDDPTEVTLLFEHQGITYEVSRQPKQTLTKKRGTGTREFPSSGKLKIFKNGEQIDEITRMQEINIKLNDILQISRRQFVQIVLLPQGDFRRFLISDSSEKETILRKVFGTQLFQKWANALKEQLNAQRDKIKSWQSVIDNGLKRVRWEEEGEHDLAQLASQQKAAKNALNQVKMNFNEKQKQVQKVQSQLESDQKMNQNIRVLNDKQKLVQTLAEQQNEITQQQTELDTLTWVSEQRHDYQSLMDLQNQVGDLQQRKQELTAAVTQQTNEIAGIEQQSKKLETQAADITNLSSKIAVLKEDRPLFEQVHELNELQQQQTAAKAQTDEQLQMAQKQQEGLTVSIKKLDEKIGRQTELLQTSANLKAELVQFQTAQQQISTLKDAQTRIDQLMAAIKADSSRGVDLANQVQVASDDYEDLRNDWLSGQIAVLASQLKPGTPCPVCGSTEHPMPHVATLERTVDNDMVKKAEMHLQALKVQQTKLLTQTENDKKNVQTKQDDFEVQLSAVYKSTGIDEHVELDQLASQITTRVSKLTQSLAKTQESLDEIKSASKERQSLSEKLQDDTDNVKKLQESVQSVQLSLQKTTAELETAQKRLPDQFKDLTSFDDYIDQQQKKITDYQSEVKKVGQKRSESSEILTTAKANLSNTDDLLHTTNKKMKTLQSNLTQLIEKRFGENGMMQFKDYLARLDSMEQIRESIKSFQAKLANAQADVKAYQDIVGGHQLVDVTVQETTLSTLSSELQEEQKLVDEKQETVTVNGDILIQIKQATSQVEAQLAQINELQLLVETVAGGGDNKLGLERYVLRAQLAEILVIANQHLRQLSSGRYSLQLHLEAGTYQKNTGLEIDVYDDNVGQVRSVHTLSGGESFIAALSLALALGEIIQNESGGISIDALFVDEGFGSLDQESLSTAMKALEDVESSNRMIGIISHVTLLQETIPYQIQVQVIGQGKSEAKVVLP